MTIYETIKAAISVKQAAEHYGLKVSRNGMACFACVHACPKKAIGLTIPEVNPDARYRNEHISLQDIIEANCQKNQE